MRQPPAKVKNRQIAFVFCFGLPSVWERSTKLRIHRSHSCNFFYRSYSRILAPYCNSSHITKAIAIEWGVKSSLYKCYMITYPSVLRSPSVFRVWAAIPSEYMALSQTFSVTSHMEVFDCPCTAHVATNKVRSLSQGGTCIWIELASRQGSGIYEFRPRI